MAEDGRPITRAIELTDVNGGTLASVWSWDAGDEFVVVVEITDSKTTVRWEFDRQIVIDGIDEMAGLWDVKMRPAGKGNVRLVLSNDNGHIDLDCPRGELKAFVKAILPQLPEPRLPSDAEMAAFVERCADPTDGWWPGG